MTEINPSSWHWKLVSNYFAYDLAHREQISICAYFWMFIGAIIAKITIGSPLKYLIIAGLISAFLILPLSTVCLSIMNGTFHSIYTDYGGKCAYWLTGLFGLGLLDVALATITVWFLGIPYIIDAISYINKRDAYKLVRAFLKAKKDKVCPILKLPTAPDPRPE